MLLPCGREMMAVREWRAALRCVGDAASCTLTAFGYALPPRAGALLHLLRLCFL